MWSVPIIINANNVKSCAVEFKIKFIKLKDLKILTHNIVCQVKTKSMINGSELITADNKYLRLANISKY